MDFQVGFGRVNITPNPDTDIAMGGYSNQISTGTLTPLLASCVAITDSQGSTLLLYTMDLTDMQKDPIDALRKKITAATGIPGENITISCTHTHSAPFKSWLIEAVDLLVQAGLDALADRVPATLSLGSYEVPQMNWTRHYIMNDGSYAGDNYGNHSVGYKDYASAADKTMRLIRFQRAGKKDVLLVNWQVHPKLTSTWDTPEGRATRYLFSSDFIGYTRDAVEEEQDVLFAYFNGASGNVNPFSKLDSEKDAVSKDGKVYGQQFARHVITALSNLEPAEAGNISVKTAPLGDGEFELHAYCMGKNLGFATVPVEIFHETGTQIREGSACRMTFVLSCANGRNTYIPISDAWDFQSNNGQIPYEVRICRYPRGTAESLGKELGAMLTELAGQ